SCKLVGPSPSFPLLEALGAPPSHRTESRARRTPLPLHPPNVSGRGRGAQGLDAAIGLSEHRSTMASCGVGSAPTLITISSSSWVFPRAVPPRAGLIQSHRRRHCLGSPFPRARGYRLYTVRSAWRRRPVKRRRSKRSCSDANSTLLSALQVLAGYRKDPPGTDHRALRQQQLGKIQRLADAPPAETDSRIA